MTEKIYIYIQKIYSSEFGRRQTISDLQGSKEELEELLKKYNIKSHSQESVINKYTDRVSVTFISYHYVLTPIFNNKV